MIDLVSLNRATRPWTQDAIDRSIIVPLLCQGSLHLRGHVAGRSVAVPEDRAVVNIVAVIGIIPVGGIPPPAIPIPITATVTDEAVIVAPPPIAVVMFPPIPALRGTKRPFISGAFVMFPRLFVPLRIVVGDNVILVLVLGFFGLNNLGVPLIVIGSRPGVRIPRLDGRLLHHLLVARLRADMPVTGLRPPILVACLRSAAVLGCLRSARLWRGHCLARGLRLFLLLLFLLIVGLRGLHRCQAHQ